jgi:hypothetical protein
VCASGSAGVAVAEPVHGLPHAQLGSWRVSHTHSATATYTRPATPTIHPVCRCGSVGRRTSHARPLAAGGRRTTSSRPTRPTRPCRAADCRRPEVTAAHAETPVDHCGCCGGRDRRGDRRGDRGGLRDAGGWVSPLLASRGRCRPTAGTPGGWHAGDLFREQRTLESGVGWVCPTSAWSDRRLGASRLNSLRSQALDALPARTSSEALHQSARTRGGTTCTWSTTARRSGSSSAGTAGSLAAWLSGCGSCSGSRWRTSAPPGRAPGEPQARESTGRAAGLAGSVAGDGSITASYAGTTRRPSGAARAARVIVPRDGWPSTPIWTTSPAPGREAPRWPPGVSGGFETDHRTIRTRWTGCGPRCTCRRVAPGAGDGGGAQSRSPRAAVEMPHRTGPSDALPGLATSRTVSAGSGR